MDKIDMRKENFIINNFVYHEIKENNLIIQNSRGIVRIYDSRMITLLKEWDGATNKEVDREDLENKFKSHSDEAVEFLIKYGIIRKKESFNFGIDKLLFISDYPQVNELVARFFEEDIKGHCEAKVLNLEEVTLDLIKPKTFLMVFIHSYRKAEAKKIRDLVRRVPNSYLLMSYVYYNTFYIDSLFCPDWKNPCHLCHMGYIESKLRMDISGNITYQQMIDSLYHEDETFRVESALSFDQMLNIVNCAINRINKYITLFNGNTVYPEEFHECLMMDLKTKKIHVDNSLHWEMCDCYE